MSELTPQSPVSPESASPEEEEYLPEGSTPLEADPVDIVEQTIEVDLGEDEL